MDVNGRKNGQPDQPDAEGVQTAGHGSLSAAQLAEAAERLASTRRELTREFDECMRELRSDSQTKSSDDDSAECLTDAVLTSSIQHLFQHIREIDLAIARLAEGRYGLCQDCSQLIPPSRLQANPAAACCISCQRDKELRQRGWGSGPS